MALKPADPIGTSSASSRRATAVATAGARERLTAIRIAAPSSAGRDRRRRTGREGRRQARHRHRPRRQLTVHHQGHVNRPVVPALGVLPGAVQGVDDPHPRRLQADRVVDGLLGEHGVARADLRQGAGRAARATACPPRRRVRPDRRRRAPGGGVGAATQPRRPTRWQGRGRRAPCPGSQSATVPGSRPSRPEAAW